MRVTVGLAARSVRIALSDRQAIAVFVAGVMIETLGLAVCGLGIAVIGDRCWSTPDQSVSVAGYVRELVSASNRNRRPAGPRTGGTR